jgi:hypothetical protein
MAERIPAAVLIALFAWFLYISVSDSVGLVEAGRFGDVFMLLFCAVACAGWIGFLAALCWPAARDRSALAHFPQRWATRGGRLRDRAKEGSGRGCSLWAGSAVPIPGAMS